MSHSLTIIIPNRNRDLSIVAKTLKAIVQQLTEMTKVVMVDYGSSASYQKELRKLVQRYELIALKELPVSRQLWNKSRAINIVLKTCETSHVMVADVDMIFHPNFITEIWPTLNDRETLYFPVGILTEAESKKEIEFEAHTIKFITNEEATGITIFPTKIVQSLNGFDEFYHGWGSEDTDMHVRLKNAGHPVTFRSDDLYFLHQWHPKVYRSKESIEPFHSYLEQINASYLAMARKQKRSIANQKVEWGKVPCVLELPLTEQPYYCTNKREEVHALKYHIGELAKGEVVYAVIQEDLEYKSVKTFVKKCLGKKTATYLDLDTVNDLVLEVLIGKLRNTPYEYVYDRQKKQITLKLSIPK